MNSFKFLLAWRPLAAVVALIASFGLLAPRARAADHNDPNAVNSIFSDVPQDAADLYDFFGFPSGTTGSGEESVTLALTFAPVPKTAVFDSDLLYRILVSPGKRLSSSFKGEPGVIDYISHLIAVKNKYVALAPAEIRVVVDASNQAHVDFLGFPSGSFSRTIALNTVVTIETPNGQSIKAYIGGRDDAFFNDLPGFFRSINYAPQFYKVPHANVQSRETPIPKTLLELEGNTPFNFDPQHPLLGQGEKSALPQKPFSWGGSHFAKDADGNYRFVYSGKDAQAKRDVNAIIVEVPLTFLTKTPQIDRVVNAWGESWVLKASQKVPNIPNDRPPLHAPWPLRLGWLAPAIVILLGVLLFRQSVVSWRRLATRQGSRIWPVVGWALGLVLIAVGLYSGLTISAIARQKPALAKAPAELDEVLRRYKLIDTDGQPFADAALNLREDDRQLGGYNITLGPSFVTRLAHLGWGFGPSITALGLKTSFNHDGATVSVYKTDSTFVDAFLRSRKVIFQELNMPDKSWNPKGLDIPLRRAVDIFVPNVCAIDMDTTGTWPYGRRPEDQVATRFLSLFLDMSAQIGGKPYNIETLSDQSLWDHARITPKTPPNPLKNDKEFLKEFPYLAEPWNRSY